MCFYAIEVGLVPWNPAVVRPFEILLKIWMQNPLDIVEVVWVEHFVGLVGPRCMQGTSGSRPFCKIPGRLGGFISLRQITLIWPLSPDQVPRNECILVFIVSVSGESLFGLDRVLFRHEFLRPHRGG